MKTIRDRLGERLLGQDQKCFSDALRDFPFGQPVEAGLLRERITREDGLLNSRTSIFLVLNGLAAVAATNLGKNTNHYCWLASALAVVVNLLWFYCSRQSLRVLAAVTRCYLKVASNEPVEKLVQQVLGSHHLWRPSAILGVCLPGLAVVSWLAVFLATSPQSFRLGAVVLIIGFALYQTWLILGGKVDMTHEEKAEIDKTPGIS
jgi:hypothetical protein